MANIVAIKDAFKERYQAELDVGIVFRIKNGYFSVADVVFELEGRDVAVKIVREDDSIGSLLQFFRECQMETYYPLFLFRAPNSSPQAVVCSYLNSAAFAVDEALRITPFKIDKEGLKVSTKTFSIDDFTCRKKYFINNSIDIFDFVLAKGKYLNCFFKEKADYRILKREKRKTTEEKPISEGENRKKTSVYDEKELEDLFLAMDYENLFKKLYPVIRCGLNLALEDRCCDEDMIQDVCLIIWGKILAEEIKKPGSLGAFTISVCKFYVLNMWRKQRGRARIEERLATLMDIYC